MKKMIGFALGCLLSVSMGASVLAAQPAATVENTKAQVASGTTLEADFADGVARFPQKRVNLVKGKKIKVQATAFNKEGQKVKLTYKSSNPNVAKVHKTNGTITAKNNGTAKITVTGRGVKKATLTVKVVSKSKAVKATGVSITGWGDDEKLYIGESKTINATPYPANATGAKISYTSDDSSVATVTSSGTVTGVGTGETRIAVRCGTSTAYCSLKVGKRPTQLNKSIYSGHGITVVADNMRFIVGNTGVFGGFSNELTCTVTNQYGTAERIAVAFKNVKINGYQVRDGSWAQIDRNASGSIALGLYLADLEKYGIKDINTISFNLEFQEANKYGIQGETIDFSALITLHV